MTSAFRSWLAGLVVLASLSCAGLVGSHEDAGGSSVDSGVAADAGGVTTDAGTLGDTDGGSRLEDAGQAIDASVTCPTAPPFDLAAPELRQCFEPILVALGDRTRRMVSYDAVDWLADVIDDGNVINGQALDDGAFEAAFGQGFIVTASDFGIFTSRDRGMTWVKAPPPAAQQWGQGVHVSPVLYNGTRFIIFGETTAYTSEDAFAWAKHALTGMRGGHFAFYGHAVGRAGRIVANGGGSEVNLTDDGVTWRSVDTGLSGGMPSMAYGNGVFVAVGKQARLFSTDNGESWTKVVDDCGANDPTKCVGDFPSRVMFHDGVFVFTTSAAKSAVLESPDGQIWSKVGDGFGFDWQHVIFKGVDYAAQSGNTYRKGMSSGGPWSNLDFAMTHQEFDIGHFSTGLVLKR